jgi:DNA-binding NarL/FixJ family response regulator
MRVVLVGPAAERQRLRARLPPGVEVAAEYETAEDARAAGIAADAVMTAPATAGRRDGSAKEPPPGEMPVEHLTPRELQVLALLAEGLSNRGIAARLHISDQTVKFHVASIMGKLGTGNRVETVRLAVRRGLISL